MKRPPLVKLLKNQLIGRKSAIFQRSLSSCRWPVQRLEPGGVVVHGEVGLTTAVLCFVFAVWPLIAFLGGLAFSPLTGVAALLTSPASLPRLRPRLYIIALLAFFAYAAATVMWSPRTFALIDFEKLSVRSEVLRLGLLLAAGGALMAAAQGVSENGRRLVIRVTMIALFVQLLAVIALSTFELASIQLFYGHDAPADEGVQNITRNALIITVAAPFLILQLVEGRGRITSFAISGVILAAVIAFLIAREIDAGLLALAGTAICYGIVRVFRRIGFRIIGGLIALAIMISPLIFQFISSGANAATAVNSMQYRQVIWKRVLEFIWDKPVFGSGVGALRAYREQIPDGVFAGQLLVPNHPHNMLLQVWAETGGVGAALLSVVVLLAAFRLPRPETLGLSALRISAIIGGLTASWVSFDIWNEWWWAVFCLLSTLTVVQHRSRNPIGGAG